MVIKIFRRKTKIDIHYRDKTVKKVCTDIKKAQKIYNKIVAEKLHSLINLLENAETLHDINAMQIYNLHPLHGDRKGQYALDIGRRLGYRLIIIPLDENGNEFERKDVNIIYKATKVVLAWEVTKHYE